MSDQWMGSVAAQDQYRPLGNDPWTNTMRGTQPAPGQGFAMSADPVLYPTASPLVNITEGDIKRATEVGLAASGGGIKGQQIKAYHSSPHDFDKFDFAKIGTGEGAQVYGHGLYFAENPAVSGQGGQYWNQFLRHQSLPKHELEAAQILRNNNFDRAAAAREVEGLVKHYDDKYSRDMLKVLQSDKPVGPRTYEVNIKADPAHMLDWDVGLHRQSPEVRSALERFGFKSDKGLMKASDDALYEALTGNPNTKIPQALPDPSGAQIYESSKLVPGGYRDKVRATAALQEAGIPGIKYLDQGSRGTNVQILSPSDTVHGQWLVKQIPNGQVLYRGADEAAARAAHAAAPKPSSNYVVFDPSIIDIMKKYGIAGAAPVGMGALAAQDAYQAER